ncbi:MAG: Fe-only/vanadium nitrogenase subunit delta [Bryobacteraceae bacterium]
MKEFHWLTEIDASERHALLEGVADELRDIAITQSKNVELNIEGY